MCSTLELLSSSNFWCSAFFARRSRAATSCALQASVSKSLCMALTRLQGLRVSDSLISQEVFETAKPKHKQNTRQNAGT